METITKIANLLLSEDQANRYIGASIILSQNIDLDKVFDTYKHKILQEIKAVFERGAKAFYSGDYFDETYEFHLFSFKLGGWVWSPPSSRELDYSITISTSSEILDTFLLEKIKGVDDVFFNTKTAFYCISEFIELAKPLFELPNLENI